MEADGFELQNFPDFLLFLIIGGDHALVYRIRMFLGLNRLFCRSYDLP